MAKKIRYPAADDLFRVSLKKKETLAPRGKILRDASVSQLCLVYSRKSPKINW